MIGLQTFEWVNTRTPGFFTAPTRHVSMPHRPPAEAIVAGSVTKVTELEEAKRIVATAGLRNGAFSWKPSAEADPG